MSQINEYCIEYADVKVIVKAENYPSALQEGAIKFGVEPGELKCTKIRLK